MRTAVILPFGTSLLCSSLEFKANRIFVFEFRIPATNNAALVLQTKKILSLQVLCQSFGHPPGHTPLEYVTRIIQYHAYVDHNTSRRASWIPAAAMHYF